MADKPRILVVDDEEVILISVKKVLRKDDYEIETASSATEAVERMKTESFDVIITDLMMPGMTGLDLLDRIAEMELPSRAIMITGYATMKTAMQAMQKGAFDYVAKPFTRDELRSVVLRAVRSKPQSGEDEFGPRPVQADNPLAPGRIVVLRNHSWARIREDGKVTIGLAPSLLANTGPLLSIEVPAAGEHVSQGKACTRLIAEDARVHAMWAPLSGRIVERNEEVLEKPRLATEDPMGRGWLLVVDPTSIEYEIENLL